MVSRPNLCECAGVVGLSGFGQCGLKFCLGHLSERELESRLSHAKPTASTRAKCRFRGPSPTLPSPTLLAWPPCLFPSRFCGFPCRDRSIKKAAQHIYRPLVDARCWMNVRPNIVAFQTKEKTFVNTEITGDGVCPESAEIKDVLYNAELHHLNQVKQSIAARS
jgi:hypothetical protein